MVYSNNMFKKLSLHFIIYKNYLSTSLYYSSSEDALFSSFCTKSLVNAQYACSTLITREVGLVSKNETVMKKKQKIRKKNKVYRTM